MKKISLSLSLFMSISFFQIQSMELIKKIANDPFARVGAGTLGFMGIVGIISGWSAKKDSNIIRLKRVLEEELPDEVRRYIARDSEYRGFVRLYAEAKAYELLGYKKEAQGLYKVLDAEVCLDRMHGIKIPKELMPELTL